MEKVLIFVMWFGKKPDMSPDYSKKFHSTFVGTTPHEAFTKYRQYLENNHDLSKYTQPEIIEIF